jgi:hypothetical protein
MALRRARATRKRGFLRQAEDKLAGRGLVTFNGLEKGEGDSEEEHRPNEK